MGHVRVALQHVFRIDHNRRRRIRRIPLQVGRVLASGHNRRVAFAYAGLAAERLAGENAVAGVRVQKACRQGQYRFLLRVRNVPDPVFELLLDIVFP